MIKIDQYVKMDASQQYTAQNGCICGKGHMGERLLAIDGACSLDYLEYQLEHN